MWTTNSSRGPCGLPARKNPQSESGVSAYHKVSRTGSRRTCLTAIVLIGFAASGSSGAFAQSYKDGECDPYKNYSCLDAYLGTNVLQRFFNYYQLEWDHGTAPADPKAPPASREGWPKTPETVPPMAYTEWPTGALTSI